MHYYVGHPPLSFGVRPTPNTLLVYTVYLGREPIGYSPLDRADLSMGVVFGSFTPAPAYEQVRAVFRLFAENEKARPEYLAIYYQERDKLNLRLMDPEGRQVRTAAIHIADYSVEVGPAGCELEVHLADAAAWPSLGGEA